MLQNIPYNNRKVTTVILSSNRGNNPAFLLIFLVLGLLRGTNDRSVF